MPLPNELAALIPEWSRRASFKDRMQAVYQVAVFLVLAALDPPELKSTRDLRQPLVNILTRMYSTATSSPPTEERLLNYEEFEELLKQPPTPAPAFRVATGLVVECADVLSGRRSGQEEIPVILRHTILLSSQDARLQDALDRTLRPLLVASETPDEVDRSTSGILGLEFYIDPGEATEDEIADVLFAMSEVQRAAGGLGLEFKRSGQSVIVQGAGQ